MLSDLANKATPNFLGGLFPKKVNSFYIRANTIHSVRYRRQRQVSHIQVNTVVVLLLHHAARTGLPLLLAAHCAAKEWRDSHAALYGTSTRVTAVKPVYAAWCVGN